MDTAERGLCPALAQDIIVIIDLKAFGLWHLQFPRYFAGLVDVMNFHYPGRYQHVYLVDAPRAFRYLWPVLKKTLLPSFAKVAIWIDSRDLRRDLGKSVPDCDLGKSVPDSILPTNYGGMCSPINIPIPNVKKIIDGVGHPVCGCGMCSNGTTLDRVALARARRL